MYSWHKVLLYVNFVVFLGLVQVGLELFEAQGVALFMSPKVFGFILKALVGKMDLVVLGGARIVI